MKVTGPDGVTVGEVIFTANVTVCPMADGFGEDMSVAELVVCSTIWFRTCDTLGGLIASPL